MKMEHLEGASLKITCLLLSSKFTTLGWSMSLILFQGLLQNWWLIRTVSNRDCDFGDIPYRYTRQTFQTNPATWYMKPSLYLPIFAILFHDILITCYLTPPCLIFFIGSQAILEPQPNSFKALWCQLGSARQSELPDPEAWSCWRLLVVDTEKAQLWYTWYGY